VPGSCLLPLLLLLRSRGRVGPALLLFFSSLTTSQARPRTPSFECGRGAAGSWRCCLRLGPSTRSDWPKLLSRSAFHWSKLLPVTEHSLWSTFLSRSASIGRNSYQGALCIGRNSLSRSTLFGWNSFHRALPLVTVLIKRTFWQ